MTGKWKIIVSEAGINYALNSSAEGPGNYAAHNSASVTLVTTYARFGDYAYAVVTGAVNRGISLTLAALPDAAAYVTFYVHDIIAGTLQVNLNVAGDYDNAAVIGGASGGWVRYGVAVAQSRANGSVALIIRDSANENFGLDGVQVESAAYPTTYIDGDQGPLYKWTGLRHASTSTRDAQERMAGRERDLEDTYGIRVRQMPGAGMPPVGLNMQGQALQPGASFQSSKIGARSMTLQLALKDTSVELLHDQRQDLIDLIRPDRTRGNQPFVLGYSGANSAKTVYAAFRYAGGLELLNVDGGGNWIEGGGKVPVTLVATDPYWYEDSRETVALDFTDSVADSAYANRRHNGQWKALGSGLNGNAYVIAVDRQRSRVYYGGVFTTANGVTVNGICYWNGTTFVAMDSGVNAEVFAIAIAANGDVWIGGAFTTVGAGAAATKGLARWNIASGTWSAFNESTSTFTGIYSIAISAAGIIYIAGDFTNWEADAGSDYIASSANSGGDWDSLGTQPFSATNIPSRSHTALLVDTAGNLWAGSSESGGSTISNVFKWSGSAWTTVLSTNAASGTRIYTIREAPDGTLYIGGVFSTLGGITAANIAAYNGVTASALGSGTNGTVLVITNVASGGILLGGNFTTAGSLALADRVAGWNGYTFTHLDIDLPGTPNVYAMATFGDDIYLGYTTTGTATAAGLTTVTTTGTTSVFPDITIIGPSSATATLQWIENQTTGERLFFNLTVNTLETLGISFQTGKKYVVSLWAGRPGVFFISKGGLSSWEETYGRDRSATIIRGQPLTGSDFAAWHLQAGANTIATFATGTTTAMVMLLHYVPRHWAIDGSA